VTARAPATIGIVAHRDRPVAHELARSTAQALRDDGVDVRVPAGIAESIGLPELAVDPADFANGLDLAISLGGDGTMLATVQLVYPEPVAVLGVNVGQLGYLSEIEPGDLPANLPRLVAGEYAISERMMLEVLVESTSRAAGTWYALNEVVLEKVRSGHMIRLEAFINGSPFTSYAADGVIVATPTGTTAYSLSAGGPIVAPDLRCSVLTPIAPHMLFDRSLVLGENDDLALLVCDDRAVEMTTDGREVGPLATGDRVTCRAAKEPLRLVSLRPRDFHQILKTKFSLPDR
jgi:NAD+ kinase